MGVITYPCSSSDTGLADSCKQDAPDDNVKCRIMATQNYKGRDVNVIFTVPTDRSDGAVENEIKFGFIG